MRTITMPRRVAAGLFTASILAVGAVTVSSTVAFATKDHAKQEICHPVEGKGETGTGWDLISPDKASSHIDESLYPDGVYWKHETKDGRHDVYAVDGVCPGGPTPSTTTGGTTSTTTGVEVPTFPAAS